MWLQKHSQRDWTRPPVYGHGDSGCEAIAIERSDFSPVFWLASASGGAGNRPVPLKSYPVYPLLIGALLIFAFAIQRGL